MAIYITLTSPIDTGKLNICPRTSTHSGATQHVNHCDIQELLHLMHLLQYFG